TDNVLGELYRASKEGLPELIATVSPDLRAALALYCYRRCHLQAIGLAIAWTCEEHDLVASGGIGGATLFARSRAAASRPLVTSHYVTRKTISLAQGLLRALP